MHEKDIQYFSEYPAPVMEHIQKLHFTNVNSTITYFGPMLYFLIRALGCEQVLELGHAEGYSSFYMANAVKDNGTRFSMKDNMYYGVDIVQTQKTIDKMNAEGLPNKIINLDSALITPDTFKGIKFDLIFQDGAHDTEHVVHEMKTLYPQLKGGGKGYWIFHDCFGPSEEGFKAVINDPQFNWEWCRIFCVYGLGILRKMDGWDEDKRHWKD